MSALQNRQGAGNGQHEGGGNEGQRHGPAAGVLRNFLSEDGDPIPAPHHAVHQQQQRRQRGGLDTAAGGRGGRADQHHQAAEQLGGVVQRILTNGGKTRRAAGDGLKNAAGHFVPQGHALPAQRGRIPSLQQEDGQRAAHQQGSVDGQHQLGVQGHPAQAFAMAQQLQHHSKAHAAQLNQADQRPQHHGILPEGKQAVAVAEQVKACVAEGAHRRKQAQPQAPGRSVAGNQPRGQQRRARQLDCQRHGEKPQAQAHHAGKAVLVHGLA